MTTIKNVALLGASGNLGPSIVDAFLKNGSFNITAISRSESKATFPTSIKVIKTDLTNDDSLTSAFKGQDAAVIIVGAGQLSEQKRYIDAAIAAGVKRFIPSEFGSDTSNPKSSELVPVFRPKVEAVEYLKSKESNTFSWTSVCTGAFFDWGLKTGFLGFNLQERSAKIWDDGNTPFSTTNLALIGEAVVSILTPEHVQETKNTTVYVASHTTTQNKILAGFEKITGDKWKVEHVDSAALLEESTNKLKAGNFGLDVIYSLIQTIAFGKGLGNLGEHSTKVWNQKLGLREEDFENDLKTVLKA